jgi:hypothetical protein
MKYVRKTTNNGEKTDVYENLNIKETMKKNQCYE